MTETTTPEQPRDHLLAYRVTQIETRVDRIADRQAENESRFDTKLTEVGFEIRGIKSRIDDIAKALDGTKLTADEVRRLRAELDKLQTLADTVDRLTKDTNALKNAKAVETARYKPFWYVVERIAQWAIPAGLVYAFTQFGGNG